MNEPPALWQRLDRVIKFLEDSLLFSLLVALIVIATAQIVMRNVFGTGLTWSDESMRLLVLWLAMAAAIAAARDDRHIAIDILSRFLSGVSLALIRSVTAVFTAVVCALLCWHSLRFVSDTRAFEDTLLGSVPAWWLQSILPVAFGLMSWRYLVNALSAMLSMRK